METIKGTISRIFYEGSEWSAFLFTDEDGNTVKANGNAGPVAVGLSCELSGEWFVDPKWGPQFKVSGTKRNEIKKAPQVLRAKKTKSRGKAMRYEPPAEDPRITEAAFLSYLSSGFIEGIGPKIAEKVYEKFGRATADVLENHSLLLTTVSGITEAKANKISACHKRAKPLLELILLLKPEATDWQIRTIYEKYGKGAVNVIKDNPYRLTEEVPGFGFIKADRVALAAGIPKSDRRRVRAAILHAATIESRQNGHLFIYPPSMEAACEKLIGKIDTNVLANEVIKLKADGVIFVDGDGAIYPKDLYLAETGVAEIVGKMTKTDPQKPVSAT
jgi:exodeoxyribonuclease V alpha subunit